LGDKKMINKKITLGLILAAMSGVAMAGSTNATFQASATINASCVVAASNVSFGAITPASTGTATASGAITSTCSNSVPYTLAINAGSGTIAARKMAGSASDNLDKLAYNLYTSSALTTVWGDGTTGSTVSMTGSGVAQSNTIYGSLALDQYLVPDTYTDNLTVTLAY
jgi:spore coat protein U-like protein